MSYRLQFIGSTRSMDISLSNLVNNLAQTIYTIKCKYQHDNKNCETCRIKYKDCDCFLEYSNFKDNLLEYKCLYCNKNYQKMFDENLKNNFLICTNFLTMTSVSLFYYC